MAQVYGFNEVSALFDRLEENTSGAEDTVIKYADLMQEAARRNFQRVTRTRTGEGAKGIQVNHETSQSEVGWGPRPGFHPFFFEHGFVAKDNRNKNIPIRRRRGTWIPARPHMRPAFEEYVNDFLSEASKNLHKGAK